MARWFTSIFFALAAAGAVAIPPQVCSTNDCQQHDALLPKDEVALLQRSTTVIQRHEAKEKEEEAASLAEEAPAEVKEALAKAPAEEMAKAGEDMPLFMQAGEDMPAADADSDCFISIGLRKCCKTLCTDATLPTGEEFNAVLTRCAVVEKKPIFLSGGGFVCKEICMSGQRGANQQMVNKQIAVFRKDSTQKGSTCYSSAEEADDPSVSYKAPSSGGGWSSGGGGGSIAGDIVNGILS